MARYGEDYRIAENLSLEGFLPEVLSTEGRPIVVDLFQVDLFSEDLFRGDLQTCHIEAHQREDRLMRHQYQPDILTQQVILQTLVIPS